jgi:hypothetical protein
MNSIEHPTMSNGNPASRTTVNLRLVGTDVKLNKIGINKMCDGEMNKYGECRIFKFGIVKASKSSPL